MGPQNTPLQPTTIATKTNFLSTILVDRIKLARIILRAGLVFIFMWAAVYMSLKPADYIKYIPGFVQQIIPGYLSLHLFAVFETILSIALLSSKKSFYVALIAAAALFALTSFNLWAFNILFRNVCLVAAALALAALSFDKPKVSN